MHQAGSDGLVGPILRVSWDIFSSENSSRQKVNPRYLLRIKLPLRVYDPGFQEGMNSMVVVTYARIM